jgi:Ca2+-binding RTX toxin-like protein
MLISVIFISGSIDSNFDFWIQQNDHFDSSDHSGKGLVLKDGDEAQTFFLSQAFGGNDVLTFQSTVKSPQGDLTSCHGNIIMPNTVCVGTIKNDTIIGTIGGGTIFGNDGNDKIQGLLSQQVIFGNAGNDTIQGGNSTNAIFGNNGNDTIVAGSGFDLLKGGGGSLLVGGEGSDKILGGPDHDILQGGPGHDFFQCNGKVDLVLDFNPDEDQALDNCIFK